MSRAIGVALDIDGVLLKGKQVLPVAKQALELLIQHKIPYIFMTNNGGVSEVNKALDLSEKFGIEVPSRQVLLSHTPMRSLVPSLAHSPVLILGSANCMDIAREYGFGNTYSTNMMHAMYPDIFPSLKPKEVLGRPSPSSIQLKDFKAILNFHDPQDWALDLQIASDIILSQALSSASIPYYACNPDMVYPASYPRPRYTQGAFNECLRSLLKKSFDFELKISYFGKPNLVQYEFAENMLHWEANLLKKAPPTRYYGIGDNPKADIRGANNAGKAWKSVLVKTGIFQPPTGVLNDATDPAHFVVEDIFEAVALIVRQHDRD